MLEPANYPWRLYRYDVVTRRKDLLRDLSPVDLAGLNSISRIVLTRDASSYAYSYLRVLSYLQLVDGMK